MSAVDSQKHPLVEVHVYQDELEAIAHESGFFGRIGYDSAPISIDEHSHVGEGGATKACYQAARLIGMTSRFRDPMNRSTLVCVDLRGEPTGDFSREEWTRLKHRMEQEDDIRHLLRLERIDGGRYRYLIETPFKTFPKYVIGTTDALFDDVRIEHRCGLLTSSEHAWPFLMKGLPIPV